MKSPSANKSPAALERRGTELRALSGACPSQNASPITVARTSVKAVVFVDLSGEVDSAGFSTRSASRAVWNILGDLPAGMPVRVLLGRLRYCDDALVRALAESTKLAGHVQIEGQHPRVTEQVAKSIESAHTARAPW